MPVGPGNVPVDFNSEGDTLRSVGVLDTDGDAYLSCEQVQRSAASNFAAKNVRNENHEASCDSEGRSAKSSVKPKPIELKVRSNTSHPVVEFNNYLLWVYGFALLFENWGLLTIH